MFLFFADFAYLEKRTVQHLDFQQVTAVGMHSCKRLVDYHGICETSAQDAAPEAETAHFADADTQRWIVEEFAELGLELIIHGGISDDNGQNPLSNLIFSRHICIR